MTPSRSPRPPAPRARARALPAYGEALRRFLRALPLGAAALLLAAPLAADPAKAPAVRILAFGDSLTAGYQLPDAAAFPSVLQRALRAQGRDVVVVNGGVSGDTASGGLARLDWTLGEGADAVILELGANDMLRGVDPAVTEKALASILDQLKARRVKVLLAGMRAVPGLGRDYVARFEAIYPALAKRYDVPLYPFFLEGMAGDAAQKLPDGMHPNARGVETVVAHILPSVDALLQGVSPKS